MTPTIPDIGLSSKAMLVNLSISRWTASRYDKQISAEVAVNHNTDPSAGRYNKKLMVSEQLKNFGTIESQARAYHYSVTLPWLDDGARILPATIYLDYSPRMAVFQREWDACLQAFLPVYPALRDAEQRRLNGMWKAEDYPHPNRIARKFGFAVNILPLPDARDFRVEITETELNRIKAGVTANQFSVLINGTKDLLNRMREGVADMAERLQQTRLDSEGKEVGNFKSSVVTNLTGLLAIVPKLNLAGDPTITSLVAEIGKDLASLSIDSLKTDGALRSKTMDRAREIADRINSYLGEAA